MGFWQRTLDDRECGHPWRRRMWGSALWRI